MDQLKKKKDRNRNSKMLICLVVIIGFLAGNVSARFGLFIGPESQDYSKAVKYVDEYSSYAGLFEAREVLINNYNGDVKDTTLLEGAIKGMAASLKDPYTLYMTKEEYEKFNLSNSGLRVGIGVTITVQDDKVTIINIEEGNPADKAGLKVGDAIIKVDGTEVGNKTTTAISLISQSDSNKTVLTILRGEETFDVEVAKEEIRTEAVHFERVEDNIGYIQLKNFNEGASKEFIEALSDLRDNGVTGVIVDLRDNGGGFLTEAEKIASQFIEEGKVITTLSNKFGKEKVSKSKGGIAQDLEVVLLVNGNTASASEVLTGALRDYSVATIVGTNTYGKGIAQAPFTLENTEGALKVTIDNFYTPNGENIHKIGIKPDYEVALTEEDVKNGYSRDTDPQYLKALEVIKEKVK
ncbi:S41 family peptidase [uncultured Clostridium sp.]|uniref:S41 family peptidase n=1 Tax=uncultured Clostridium sp. TaxID=59620 RepID=UPI0025E7D4D7|nr:S41 family peptidase [uncultured Clostridium sp.]